MTIRSRGDYRYRDTGTRPVVVSNRAMMVEAMAGFSDPLPGYGRFPERIFR